MTNEEARTALGDRNNLLWGMSKEEQEYYSEALDMAISALSSGDKNCRDCAEWETCPCGKQGHANGTSKGYSIGECRDFKRAEGKYIKKEDAIEAINSNIADYIPRFIGRQVEIPLRLASAINKIPAVLSPNREKGEWIKDHEVKDIAENSCYTVYKCSKCGGFVESWKQSNFCPNCGADMRGNHE